MSSDKHEAPPYTIRRKGSFYNIIGPNGREFSKYKSASVAGPRWEELTHTPWPYQSSAYEPGTRLWQLGLIERGEIGRMEVRVTPAKPAKAPHKTAPAPLPEPPPSPPLLGVQLRLPPIALPAPRIDLVEQTRLIQRLRGNPHLLFDPEIRQALQNEVEYHRPYARWAAHLLALLARYDIRQQRHVQTGSSPAILAKHVAWQGEQLAKAAAARRT